MTNITTQLLNNLTVSELLELNKEICDLISRKLNLGLDSTEDIKFSVGDKVYCNNETRGRFWAEVEEVGQSHAYIVDMYGKRFMAPLRFLTKI